MPLQSRLLKGDQKLEEAATSDDAHVTQGARGEHVRRIQLALIQLDGARIDADGRYGPATADAVLAYKQKRKIINPSYQNQADDIVGKMTMASLDSELRRLDSLPRSPVLIVPKSYFTVRPARHPVVEQLLSHQLNFAIDAAAIDAVLGAPRILPRPNPAPNSNSNIVVHLGIKDTATVEVLNAGPDGILFVTDPSLVLVKDPATDSSATSGDHAVTKPSQTFQIESGVAVGTTQLRVTKLDGKDGLPETTSIDIVVGKSVGPPRFEAGSQHDHKPSHRWKDIQKDPNNLMGTSSDQIATESADLCRKSPTPEEFIFEMMKGKFGAFWSTKPRALAHIEWYLAGSGADFVEDANITDWLRIDPGIRSRLRKEIFPKGKKTVTRGHFTFSSVSYGHGSLSQDFHLTFGGIDRVDFEVDFSKDIVRVWFQDRYQWHPFYPGIYPFHGPTRKHPHSGDFKRPSNCVHAAMVEMKDRQDGKPKANDFWMKGVGEIPLFRLTLPDLL